MTNKEIAERNIGLTFDFVNQCIDQPKQAEQLPDEFDVAFIEKDFPNLERKQSANRVAGIRKKLVKVRNSFELL